MNTFMPFSELFGAQCRKPSGWLGWLMGPLMNWSHRPLSRWTIELMDIQPHSSILDIGCGGGMTVREMARIATGGFVAGVDYSPVMVRQSLKHNAAAVEAQRVAVKWGDIASLPFDGASFDRACAIESFNYWPEPVAGLREVYRVLKDGGLVVITTAWSKETDNQPKYAILAKRMRFPIYTGAEMMAMLTAAGFSSVRFWLKDGHGWLCARGVKRANLIDNYADKG
jgi:ubiquinone/menaquinone biosynthesis C-methylase UbiE